MKVGDPVVILKDLEIKPAGIKIPAGTIGTLQVIDYEYDHYEVEFEEDQLFILHRDELRLAEAIEAGQGFVDLGEVPF